MAVVKISELPSAVATENDDIIPIVQSGVTKKLSISTLKSDFSSIELGVSQSVTYVANGTTAIVIPDGAACVFYTVAAGGPTTWTFSSASAMVAGKVYSFVIELTNGGTNTQNWPAGVNWHGGSAPVLKTSGANILEFYTRDAGATWHAVATPAGFVSVDGVETLTNKDINGSTNTITNVSLTSSVTGTLPVAFGGTGSNSISGLIKGNGTAAFTPAVAGTDYVTPDTAVTKNSNVGAARIPVGDTSQRPDFPVDGDFRRNSQLGIWEGYDGVTWSSVSGDAVVAATESIAGKVELATAAETTTGTDSTRAVHPAGLKVELDKKANLATVNTFTAGNISQEKPLPATDGTVTLDLAQGNNFGGTLSGNIVLANPTNMVAGQSGIIRIVNNGSVAMTIAYGSYWKSPSGAMPALTATTSAVDIFGYYVESASRITLVKQGDVK